LGTGADETREPAGGMSQFDRLIHNRGAAASVSLIIGFVGSLIGIVYGWSLIFNRIWFIGWLFAAGAFGLVGVYEWALSGESQDLPAPSGDAMKSSKLDDSSASRTLEQNIGQEESQRSSAQESVPEANRGDHAEAGTTVQAPRHGASGGGL
jgi:hypothetical protein